MTGQIFFVVGHSNWGKSQTLRALTTHHQVRYWAIGSTKFFIRRMSNDDHLDKWAKFIRGLRPAQHPYVIVALCPTQDALRILEELKTRYRLFFWVIRRSYGDDRTISEKEELALRALGTVEVLEDRTKADLRARAFKMFVTTST